MGRKAYPNATRLMITADSGGSDSSRSRLWKVELQDFADMTGIGVSVSLFPPGTSKWNKIEHRLFSQVSMNWRGRPLLSHQTVVNFERRDQNPLWIESPSPTRSSTLSPRASKSPTPR
jgi:hypothetical protein